MINVFICDSFIAKRMKQKFPKILAFFGGPKVKVFFGREWFMSCCGKEELGSKYKGEKFDLMFFTAESLKKYYCDGAYDLNLETVIERHGKDTTKIIVFRCNVCTKCNDFVASEYKNINYEFCSLNTVSERDQIISQYVK